MVLVWGLKPVEMFQSATVVLVLTLHGGKGKCKVKLVLQGNYQKGNSPLGKDISIMIIPFVPLEPFFLGFTQLKKLH